MASKQYFNFVGSFWDLLSEDDRTKMGETWQGYEQVFASVYQKFVENDLNIAVRTLQPYSTERWLQYLFNANNVILRPPIFTSTQDLSAGLNLSVRYMVKFSIDDGTPYELDLRGLNPLSTTMDEIVAKINSSVGFEFARTIFQNSIIQLVAPTAGVNSNIKIFSATDPDKDATEFVFGLQFSDLPLTSPKFPYVYALPYSKVVDIPSFQDKIRDESDPDLLIKDTDYSIEKNGLIAFKNQPPTVLWAKRTLFDEETPWNNFGFLMDIYQKNTASYLSVIQGLWYAFWSGPKPDNLKRALYLLFGLPVAQEDTTVTLVTTTQIETTSQEGLVRTFSIPDQLVAIVQEGQTVERFEPLVDGIDVFDKINLPGFIQEEIGRAGIDRFLTEKASRGTGDTDETKALRMLEEHTFLPQISVDAFISPDINLRNVKTFLETIKPLSKAFLFQVIVGTFKEKLAFQEKLAFDISIDVTPNLDSNQTTFLQQADLDAYETSANSGLDLDTDGVQFQEGMEVEVYSFGLLIDSFVA